MQYHYHFSQSGLVLMIIWPQWKLGEFYYSTLFSLGFKRGHTEPNINKKWQHPWQKRSISQDRLLLNFKSAMKAEWLKIILEPMILICDKINARNNLYSKPIQIGTSTVDLLTQNRSRYVHSVKWKNYGDLFNNISFSINYFNKKNFGKRCTSECLTFVLKDKGVLRFSWI